MVITDIKVLIRDDLRLKAYVAITIDDCFIVRDIRIIQGDEGLFVAMPSRKRPNGRFRDVAHPLNAHTRKLIEEKVLKAYQSAKDDGAAPLAGDDEGDQTYGGYL